MTLSKQAIIDRTIEQDFDVIGITDLIDWEPFRKNADYLAFPVRRKF